MADKKDKAKADAPKHPNAGVVGNRKVIARPMSRKEQLERSGADIDAAAEFPDAPKPIARNEYKPVLKQLRRKHKRPGSEPKPKYMSDVKL